MVFFGDWKFINDWVGCFSLLIYSLCTWGKSRRFRFFLKEEKGGEGRHHLFSGQSILSFPIRLPTDDFPLRTGERKEKKGKRMRRVGLIKASTSLELTLSLKRRRRRKWLSSAVFKRFLLFQIFFPLKQHRKTVQTPWKFNPKWSKVHCDCASLFSLSLSGFFSFSNFSQPSISREKSRRSRERNIFRWERWREGKVGIMSDQSECVHSWRRGKGRVENRNSSLAASPPSAPSSSS